MTSLSSCGGDDGSSSYALNVYVAGLTGSGLQVTLNGGAPISISTNSQTTIARLANGASYAVAIGGQPINPAQTCSAANPSGKISGNNVDVMINCVATTSTMVTMDSTIPASVVSLISQVISPLGVGAIGSWLTISIAGPSGQSIVLCLDANNNIVLASIVTSSQTTLSSDSTALAMVRLAIGDISTADAASSIDTAIRASATYADLVTAVQNSLGRGTAPATDTAVLSDMAAVIVSLGSAIPAAPTSAKVKSIAQPTVTGPPFIVIADTLSGLLPVEITSSSVNFVTLTNPMPIPWSVSSVGPSPSSGGTGPPISTNLPLPGGTLLTAGSIQVGANNAGFNLTVQQTDATHHQIAFDLVIGAIQTSLDLAGIKLTDSCIGTALVTSLSKDLDTYLSPGESWQAFASKLEAFDVTPLISACTTSKTIKSIVSATVNLLDGVAELKLVAHAGALVGEATYAYTYWMTSPTLGVCESANWMVTNCAGSYDFTPSSIFMAPGAIYTPNLSALDINKVPTLIPAGLKYVPSNPNLVSIDQTSGQITAATGFGTVITGGGMPDTITVTDQDTAATGSFAVMVIYPQITVVGNPYPQSNPTTTSIPVGGSVFLQLTDPNGNSVVLPSGITWMSDKPATLAQVGVQSPGGSTVWSSPAGSPPDTVTVSAIAPDGTAYGTVTVTVTGPACAALACKLAGKWLDSFGYPWTINADGLTGTFEIFDQQPSSCYNASLPVTVQFSGSNSFVATAVLGNSNGIAPCDTTWVDALTLQPSGLIAQGTFTTGINKGPETWTRASGPVVIVPNVLGYDQTHAASTFALASLTVGSVTMQVATSSNCCGVISEIPAALSSVASGSAVDLVITVPPPN